jgi:hypothetical protein
MTYNGNNLLCKKSLITQIAGSNRRITGTTKIQMIGNGIIGSTGATTNIGLDLEINTSGSYLIRNFDWGYLGGKELKYSNGNITQEIGTYLGLMTAANATNTLDLDGIDFKQINFQGSVTATYTLLSNLKCILL